MNSVEQPLVRAQGLPAPQYFNAEKGVYEVIEGEYGANRFIERGRIVKDSFSGNTTITKSYTTQMFGLGIVNDGESDISVSINGFTIVLKAGEAFDDLFDAFNTFTITGNSEFRTVVRA